MPHHLHSSLAAAIERANETYAVQDLIQADWMWEGASLGLWSGWVAEFNLMPIGTPPETRPSFMGAAKSGAAEELIARAELDAGWDSIHSFTVITVGALRAKTLIDKKLCRWSTS